jgi:hypothetical protein
MSNPGFEAPVLPPNGKQRLSREKLEPVFSVSGYIYPGKICDSRGPGKDGASPFRTSRIRAKH